jgi:hypothetical protein
MNSSDPACSRGAMMQASSWMRVSQTFCVVGLQLKDFEFAHRGFSRRLSWFHLAAKPIVPVVATLS